MRKNILIISFLMIFAFAYSQNDIDAALNYTLGIRGITYSDLTIPIDFYTQSDKSPTNSSKLLMPLVRDMMIKPLRGREWMDTLLTWKDENVISVISKITKIIGSEYNVPGIEITPDDIHPEAIAEFNHNIEKEILKNFTKNDLEYLKEHLMSIFGDEEEDGGDNTDIFAYNRARDSSIQISRRTMDILSKADINKIISFYEVSYQQAYTFFWNNKNHITANISSEDGKLVFHSEKPYRIAIGGMGKNIYKGRYDLIIDYGGDDVYEIDRPYEFKNCNNCIIDLGGNDHYKTNSKFALAGALFSTGMIFDSEGDDTYESTTGNLGSAIGGLGLIYDEKGNDTYKGFSYSIGAGCFGIGLIIDREGNDIYSANSYSQGFGMTLGCGGIIDNSGNDSYIIDARSLDIGRYEDHYVTMSQGYGLGVRPYYAGGVGFIVEGAGNDIYNCDIFGQGGAYWYGLGAIADASGHDKYNGYQYAQGSGIHLAVGFLKDYDGWDFYQSNGVSQGCGHDFGFGMLWDVKGNDNYSAYSLSQGAGNANGIGLIVDESGTDGYLSKDANNTRGYGNPRREYGSLGIFLDASGTDYYSNPEMDSDDMLSSLYGVFNDYFYTDMITQQSGNQFKVPLDESRDYSTEEYFIMAKTIEPRFSLWSDYGYKKLIEDSIRAANYMLTKLGSEDHRDANVLRLISLRMKLSFANALIRHLNNYLDKKITLTQPEVSFAAYIFGETANPIGKDVLLKLTYDNDRKIRSSALNALGKIKYDTNDADYRIRVSERLRELAEENSDKKLYMKDLVFAFGNFREEKNIPVLMSLLNYDFFGVRFLSAEDLWKYGDLYYSYLINENINKVNKEFLVSLIYSLKALDQANRNEAVNRILERRNDKVMKESIKLMLKN